MSETRTCRTCGESKPLTRELWRFDNRTTPKGYYIRLDCKVCENRRGLMSEEEKAATRARQWERAYRAMEQRIAYDFRHDPIPDSDPSLDLVVVDACWRDCVYEGAPAITRMLKKIVGSCVGIHGSHALRNEAIACLGGSGDLAMVRARLDECVGLARTA